MNKYLLSALGVSLALAFAAPSMAATSTATKQPAVKTACVASKEKKCPAGHKIVAHKKEITKKVETKKAS